MNLKTIHRRITVGEAQVFIYIGFGFGVILGYVIGIY